MRVLKWSGVPLPTFMVPCLNPRSNREGGEGQASPGDTLQEACTPIRSASRPEGRRHRIGALGAAGEGWAQVWGRRVARAGPGPEVPGSLPSAGPGSCVVLSQPRPGVQPLCSRPRLCPRCRACSARQRRGLGSERPKEPRQRGAQGERRCSTIGRGRVPSETRRVGQRDGECGRPGIWSLAQACYFFPV